MHRTQQTHTKYTKIHALNTPYIDRSITLNTLIALNTLNELSTASKSTLNTLKHKH